MSKRTGIIHKKLAQGIDSPLRPRLLTLKAASEYLGLTIWAMRERIWSGAIPVVRFRKGNGDWQRKMYIDTQDIESFIQKNKTTII